MRVLIASRGSARGDFCHALVGEIAVESFSCDLAGCGCGTAWTGIGSGKSTTIAVVAEKPDLDRAALTEMVRHYLATAGDYPGIDEDAEGLVAETIATAEHFPVGARLRRTADEVVEAGPESPPRPRTARRRGWGRR